MATYSLASTELRSRCHRTVYLPDGRVGVIVEMRLNYAAFQPLAERVAVGVAAENALLFALLIFIEIRSRWGTIAVRFL